MGAPLTPRDLAGIDPLRYSALQPAIAASNQFLDAVTAGKVNLRDQKVLVIDGFGDMLRPIMPRAGDDAGLRNVARCIFENTRITDTPAVAGYDTLLCASRWGANVLHANTNRPVTVIHEGIDHSLFFPGPRSGTLDPECFYIFSGGKVEFRKAQDLVILAFREFAAAMMTPCS
jgi:hypothetical protein